MRVTYKTPQGALTVTVELATCGYSSSGVGDQWEEAQCIRCGKALLASNTLPRTDWGRTSHRRLDIGPRLFLAVVEHEVDCAFPKVEVITG